jgi:hypothetical protein
MYRYNSQSEFQFIRVGRLWWSRTVQLRTAGKQGTAAHIAVNRKQRSCNRKRQE